MQNCCFRFNVKYCNFNEILEKYSCIPNDIHRTEI